jgi:hypothetical protein
MILRYHGGGVGHSANAVNAPEGIQLVDDEEDNAMEVDPPPDPAANNPKTVTDEADIEPDSDDEDGSELDEEEEAGEEFADDDEEDDEEDDDYEDNGLDEF